MHTLPSQTRNQCQKYLHELTYSRTAKFFNQLLITRALEKVIKKIIDSAPINATKIFVGGIPNKASKGKITRGASFLIYALRGREGYVSTIKVKGRKQRICICCFSESFGSDESIRGFEKCSTESKTS